MSESTVPCPLCDTLPGPPAIPSVVQQFRSPRVQKLLSQNDPPLEMERANIHETITSGTTAVSLLDERILEVQRILDTFISEREQVLSCIDDARTLLHPIRTINDNVLREIFSWCVYNWEDIVSCRHSYHDSLDRLEPPWTLSHVSHRWRTISLSLPRLWTSVILKFSSYSDLMIPHRNIMFKFGLQLERSRGCDLSVSLSSGLAGIGDHPILAMLDTSSSRWKHLRADLPPEGLKSLSGNSFLRLDTLIVRICTRRNSPPRNMKIDTFQSAPQLRSFRSLDDANPSHVLLLPWSNLTKYDCSDALSSHNLTILPRLTSVETLTFTLKNDSKNPPGGGRIVMPSVTSLNVQESAKSPEGAICRLLASVSFPSATLVHMCFSMNDDRIVRFPVHAIFGELRTLQLTLNVSFDQNVRALLEFLTVADSVVDLRLCMKVVPDSLLDGLTVSQSHRILPNLRTLTFRFFGSSAGVSPFTPTVLFRMLRSRYISMKERMSDGTTDINGSSTIRTGALKELRLKSRRKLTFANLEDQQGWNAICEEIKVVYE
ncbi:hypothetical protein ARMSODRAFT_1085652 [Armillaria solidipes]|uniref:F-box domain-containing protein n=1 Tax=Armillaria solidipes TaxID=1076256 RepID=A0A2H3BYA0_9AGAR|nr:hypothetical protein ARMSODRAFT_1085652 [Armillaria solidipes]